MDQPQLQQQQQQQQKQQQHRHQEQIISADSSNSQSCSNNISQNHLFSMSLVESASSSSSSSNLLLLAANHPASPGPSPSEGISLMLTSSSSSGSAGSLPMAPPPPRHGLSIKSFASREEYLQAMLEDISYWVNELVFLNDLDPTPCTADNFFNIIETGEVLCEMANRICECIVRDSSSPSIFASFQPLTFRRRVKPESFFARDNVSTFLNWASSTWRIHECLMFETDDLVLRKSEKNVVLCLLEVARKAYASGLKVAPMLVHMEAEIDKELSQQQPQRQSSASARLGLGPVMPPSTIESSTFQQVSFNNLVSLDELVRNQLSCCTCPVQFPMIKVADGKYRIGNSNVLIFVRVLRSHVMVRVGGGWDTLEAYLNRHDPCRCQNGSHYYSSQQQQIMSLSVHQPTAQQPAQSQQSQQPFLTGIECNLMASSLVDVKPDSADALPDQTVGNDNTPTTSSFNSKTLMPPTPPLSLGDSISGGEASPSTPSPTARQRSTSRQRRSDGAPDQTGSPMKHLSEAATIVSNKNSQQAQKGSPKRQSKTIAPTLSTRDVSPRRRKSNSIAGTNHRVRSAPSSRSVDSTNSRSTILISRTATGKHVVQSSNAQNEGAPSKRRSASPMVKDRQHQAARAVLLAASQTLENCRQVAQPRKDPLTRAVPSRIPCPISSITQLLTDTTVVSSTAAQLSPSSLASSSPDQSPTKVQQSSQRLFDNDQYACVRATLVMTICEEDEDEGNELTNSSRTAVVSPSIVDVALMRSRRDTGLGSSSVSCNEDEGQHASMEQRRSMNSKSDDTDDEFLLNDFLAMEKLVESEIRMAAVTT